MAFAAPLVFEGLSIALPAVIELVQVAAVATGAAVAGAAVGTAVKGLAEMRTVARSDPPPPRRTPPKMDKAKKRAMKIMLATMMAAALKKKKDGPIAPEGWCRAEGPLNNKTDEDVLHLKDKHEWCGHFSKGPPSENKRKDELVHQGGPPKGSKAGVAYQANGYQWIVAWHVLYSTTQLKLQNKIYVEHGPVTHIDWNAIEKKLDASTKECEVDGAVGEISDGNDATIGVIFYQ